MFLRPFLTCVLLVAFAKFSFALELSELQSREGRRVLLASGAIERGDGEKVRNMLRAGTFDKGILVLNSVGGSVSDAIEIGRSIWRAEMKTMVAPKGECYSACFLSFLGGRIRHLPTSAKLGSHQFYASGDGPGDAREAISDSQAYASRIINYALQTGVNMQVFTVIFDTPADQMHEFSPTSAKLYRITTSVEIAPDQGSAIVIGNGAKRPGCPWPDDFLAQDPLGLYPDCR